MTRAGRRLIHDFLIPALDEQRYGDRLKWIDRENKIFTICWSHKNAAKWTYRDTEVFQDWDRLKGHHRPEIKGYYMQAKQRFRAALYKLNCVRKVESGDKGRKSYQLILDRQRAKDYTGVSKIRHHKNNQVSVIKKHTSGSKLQKIYIKSPPSAPSSPDCSDRSEYSDSTVEFERCIHDYKTAYKNQCSNAIRNGIRLSPSPLKEVNDDCGRGVLKTSSIQPDPVFHYYTPRFEMESPHVLLVRTYNEISACPTGRKEENHDSEEMDLDSSSDCALNLSVKSNDSDGLSR